MTQSTARASGADATNAPRATPADKKSFFVRVFMLLSYQQTACRGTARTTFGPCFCGHSRSHVIRSSTNGLRHFASLRATLFHSAVAPHRAPIIRGPTLSRDCLDNPRAVAFVDPTACCSRKTQLTPSGITRYACVDHFAACIGHDNGR